MYQIFILFAALFSMSALYNLIQLLFLPIALPIVLAVSLFTAKYRRRIWRRLGWGLKDLVGQVEVNGKKRIWLHALSVGEVTSALPLVCGLRERFPDAHLIFSTTTSSGNKVAERLMNGRVDLIVPFPLDILPVTATFVQRIRPDLFILVETDFWPNILSCLRHRDISTILVNGRISQQSMVSYRRFAFFFRPLFDTFHHLCMQTEEDRRNMIDLGIPAERVHTLGNLKFDTPRITGNTPDEGPPWFLAGQGPLFIAGSTHPGEEEILLAVYARLLKAHPDLRLVIAPRNINRDKEILNLATTRGITATCRSAMDGAQWQLLVLDTIGELAGCYRYADIAFIGGSLVALGGHNPIEPAIAKTPVLFGPHMESFTEISAQLLAAGGAVQTADQEALFQAVSTWLQHPQRRAEAGIAAFNCVKRGQGVLERHLDLIATLLESHP